MRIERQEWNWASSGGSYDKYLFNTDRYTPTAYVVSWTDKDGGLCRKIFARSEKTDAFQFASTVQTKGDVRIDTVMAVEFEVIETTRIVKETIDAKV
jgi:hypothetical protein